MNGEVLKPQEFMGEWPEVKPQDLKGSDGKHEKCENYYFNPELMPVIGEKSVKRCVLPATCFIVYKNESLTVCLDCFEELKNETP